MTAAQLLRMFWGPLAGYAIARCLLIPFSCRKVYQQPSSTGIKVQRLHTAIHELPQQQQLRTKA